MKLTSRISRSRSLHGSRPSTRNSPSYDVSPRIAFSAVVLPAPFGPISPRMRPSSTRRSTPSSATVLPYDLRRPRASMQFMSALLLSVFRRQQLLRRQSEPFDCFLHARPVLGQKLLALALKQQLPPAGPDEHATTSPGLDDLLVDQFLIGLENRDRVEAILRSEERRV